MAKEKSESELIGGEFYLIDEKKCLYASTKDDGIYYNAKGKRSEERSCRERV